MFLVFCVTSLYDALRPVKNLVFGTLTENNNSLKEPSIFPIRITCLPLCTGWLAGWGGLGGLTGWVADCWLKVLVFDTTNEIISSGVSDQMNELISLFDE